MANKKKGSSCFQLEKELFSVVSDAVQCSFRWKISKVLSWQMSVLSVSCLQTHLLFLLVQPGDLGRMVFCQKPTGK